MSESVTAGHNEKIQDGLTLFLSYVVLHEDMGLAHLARPDDPPVILPGLGEPERRAATALDRSIHVMKFGERLADKYAELERIFTNLSSSERAAILNDEFYKPVEVSRTPLPLMVAAGKWLAINAQPIAVAMGKGYFRWQLSVDKQGHPIPDNPSLPIEGYPNIFIRPPVEVDEWVVHEMIELYRPRMLQQLD